jgi:hypothetical protein
MTEVELFHSILLKNMHNSGFGVYANRLEDRISGMSWFQVEEYILNHLFYNDYQNQVLFPTLIEMRKFARKK